MAETVHAFLKAAGSDIKGESTQTSLGRADSIECLYLEQPIISGTTQQFYTVEIKDGRIATMKQFVPDTIVPASSTEPPLEEVSFVFRTITWTYTDGGITHTDDWQQNR